MPSVNLYKVLFFLFFITFEILLTISIFHNVSDLSTTVRVVEALNVLGIILYSGFIFFTNSKLMCEIASKKDAEQKIKLAKIEFDSLTNTWYANDEFKILFPLNDLTMNSLMNMFSDCEPWQTLIANIYKKTNNSEHITAVVEYDKHVLRFEGQAISYNNGKSHINIIFFINLTEENQEKLEILELYKKYRTMSYELDQILNTLPIAIWKREQDGKFLFYNVAYQKLMHHISPTITVPHETENIFVNQFKDCLIQNRRINLLKHYIVKNKVEAIKFVESPIRYAEGSVGHAEDISEMEEFNKNFKLLLSKLEKMMDFSSSGIIIVDGEQRIVQFNLTFRSIFQLENKWLCEFPTFGMLLDKLRDLNRLPETKDYRDYKTLQLKKINEFTTPYYELLHLPNGQTIKLSVVPVRSASTILIYDDITEMLKIERLYNELINVHKSLVYNLSHGVIVFGHNGKVKIFNENAKNFLSLKNSELVALPHFNDITAIINSKDRELLRQKIINCLESKIGESFTIKIKTKSIIIQLFSLPDSSIQMNIYSPSK